MEHNGIVAAIQVQIGTLKDRGTGYGHIARIPVRILTEESACGWIILSGAEVIGLRFLVSILAAVAERVI